MPKLNFILRFFFFRTDKICSTLATPMSVLNERILKYWTTLTYYFRVSMEDTWYNQLRLFLTDIYWTLLRNFKYLQLDGATYRTSQKCSAGGVGRNLAEGLLKLHGNVKLISKVGADQVYVYELLFINQNYNIVIRMIHFYQFR